MAERSRASIESSAATATGQPGFPGRRVARVAYAHRRAAHVQRAASARCRGKDEADPGEFLEQSAPADRAARLAGDQPARAVQARLGPGTLDLRPDDLRAVVENAVASRPSRQLGRKGVTLRMRPARRADPPAARSAAHRPGSGQPDRQRDQVHAARRPRSTWRLSATGRAPELRVTDTGVGIDPQELPARFRALLPRRARRTNRAPRVGTRALDRPIHRRDARWRRFDHQRAGHRHEVPSTCRATCPFLHRLLALLEPPPVTLRLAAIHRRGGGRHPLMTGYQP